MMPDFSSEITVEDSEVPATSEEPTNVEHSQETSTPADDSNQPETSEEPTSAQETSEDQTQPEETSEEPTNTENHETEEVCTCCPVLPAILDESTIAENIKKKLKEDLEKVEEDFNTQKEELQGKIRNLNEESEPHKEKLRGVRKANRDKETELNVEELSEKSLLSRKSFKELIDKVRDLSDSRLDAKRDFSDFKTSCRTKKGDDDFDEEECRNALTEKLEAVEKFNADISSTLETLITKHNEVVAIENELKVAEDELWSTIYDNRKTIEEDVNRVTEIYNQIAVVKNELEDAGEKYEKYQRLLHAKAKEDLEKLLPTKYRWVSWSNANADVPNNAIVGGYDLDGTTMYIVRSERYDDFEYGKFAAKRKQAYVTRGDDEKIVYDFDVS